MDSIDHVGWAIMIGGFVATFVIFSFWSSLVSLLTLFVSKSLVFTILMMLEMVLFVITVVNNFYTPNVRTTFIKTGLYPQSMSLLSKPKNNTSKYLMGYYVRPLKPKDLESVTVESRMDGVKLKWYGYNDNNLNLLYQDIYDYSVKHDKHAYMQYIDINSQLANLYTFYTNQFIEQSNPVVWQKKIYHDSFFMKYFKLKINNEAFKQFYKQNNMFVFPLKWEGVWYPFSLNVAKEIKFQNKEFRVFSPKFSNNYSEYGEYKWQDVDNYIFPFLIEHKNKIHAAYYDFKNLHNFAKFYFEYFPQVNYRFMTVMQHSGINGTENWSFFLVTTAMINYLSGNKNVYTLTKQEMAKLVNNLKVWIQKYQLATIHFLYDYYFSQNSTKYSWIKDEHLVYAMQSLGYYVYSKMFTDLVTTWIGTIEELNSYIDRYFPNPESCKYTNNLVYFSIPYNAVSANFANSFVTIQIQNIYNLPLMVSTYLFLVLIIYSVSATYWIKKDRIN